MRKIDIDTIDGAEILKQLQVFLGGDVVEQWGESVLEFDGDYGKGMIRSIGFDWGVSLVDYDVNFSDDTKIIFHIKDANPIEFIFISEGSVKYSNATENKELSFEQYQNIIIASKKHTTETYVFPKKIAVKVNFIYVMRNEYYKKKNNNISELSNGLSIAFAEGDAMQSYNHFGNFSLKIADQIKQLQDSFESGIIRTLSIEGQLNLIMAMQMLEHSNYENKLSIPESLSKEDIKKIHDLTGYIIENISEAMTVTSLAEKAGLVPKKLQLGFRVLYSKSVNAYVRQLKLEIARDCIKNSNDSISEIVYNIGFKSRSYFSKIFFENYGILPTDYRRSMKVIKEKAMMDVIPNRQREK